MARRCSSSSSSNANRCWCEQQRRVSTACPPQVRHKLKDVKREVKPETIKLKHAVMPRGKVRHLSPSVAPCTDNKCECCLEGCGDEKCKGCHQPLCSNCCFASEEAPTMWYCPACVFPEWYCQSTFSEGKKAKKEIQKRKGTIKKAGKLLSLIHI